MTNPHEETSAGDQTTQDRLVIHKRDPAQWTEDLQIQYVDDALVVLTQAFSHRGAPLVKEENPRFGGFPGVHLRVEAAGQRHDVYLSPVHGDHAKQGGEGIPSGTRCRILCPDSGDELPAYEHSQGADCPGTMRSIFLTDDLNPAHVVALCDVWGCQSSRVVDEWELLSEFVEQETAEG